MENYLAQFITYCLIMKSKAKLHGTIIGMLCMFDTQCMPFCNTSILYFIFVSNRYSSRYIINSVTLLFLTMELFTKRNIWIADVASTDARPLQSNVQESNAITEAALKFFNNYFTVILLSVLSPLGVTTNILNIIVYWKQGIRENVNITFIALSFWDLLQCFLLLLSEICIIIERHFPHPTVYFMSIQFVYLAHSRGCTYVLSTLATVYLSIERSICITLPFKVKDIFTTTRVVLINLLILIVGLVCFCPAWASQGLQWEFDSQTNMTHLDLWLSDDRRKVDLFVDTFNGIVIPIAAQLLITISGGLMAQGISKSNKFRQKSTDTWKPAHVFNLNDELHTTTTTSNSSARGKTMANKDIKLTKVVVSLASIFFVCNVPVVLVAILRAIIPELDVGKTLFSWYILLYTIVYFFGLINCTVNIFIYYNVSTRYRRDFLALFCRNNCML